MRRLRSIRLVARREILERGRSRGFLLSVGFTTLFIIGAFLIPMFLFDDDDTRKLGLTTPAPVGLAAALVEQAQTLGEQLEVTELADPEAAAQALEAGEVEAVIEVPADLSGSGSLRFEEGADALLTQLVSATVIDLRSAVVLADADVDMAALRAAQDAPTVTIADPPEADTEGRFIVANIAAVLILVGIFGFGFTVLSGVVEEKQSRVVEVVLATVRARDLLMGKVIGIGILGLIQVAVFVIAALLASLATQQLELPSTTPAAILLLAVWFILGYTLYATVLGALAALASRMEEASNVSTPVTAVAVSSYFVSLFAVSNDPSGPLAIIATYLPPTAPFVVPIRAAFDAIPPWEIGLAIIVTVATIGLLFEVGARIYTGAVLETAGRMKLRDAWRAGR
jgi:ABC-2 type transport system permease protein